MTLIVPDDKPDFAGALACAVETLNSDDGAQFMALRKAGAPIGVLGEWSYSTLDRAARRRRKAMVYSVAYGKTFALVDGEIVVTVIVPRTDPDEWKAANPDLVAAFDIQFRQQPPRKQS